MTEKMLGAAQALAQLYARSLQTGLLPVCPGAADEPRAGWLAGSAVGRKQWLQRNAWALVTGADLPSEQGKGCALVQQRGKRHFHLLAQPLLGP